MRPSDQIMHNVPFGNPIGGFAPMAQTAMPLDALRNTSSELADALREVHAILPRVERSGMYSPTPATTAQFLNSTLGVFDLEHDLVYRVGNTVPRLCPHGGNPDVEALPFEQRLALGCASAYIEQAFMAGEHPEEQAVRLMFVPGFPKGATARDDVLLLEEHALSSFEAVQAGPDGDVLMRRLPNCHAVIVSEQWMQDCPRVTIGINAADATFGVASFVIPAGDGRDEEGFHIVFCTQRENMGRRNDELAQPIATAVDVVLERMGVDASIMQGVEITVALGSSATLEHFAHDLTLPTPMYNGNRNGHVEPILELLDISFEEYERRYENTMQLQENPDLDFGPDDIIKSSVVMETQYPGSLEGDGDGTFVFGAGPAGLEPRTADGCPGFGELCHLDYRRMTRDTIAFQLARFGMNVVFDESLSVDPSDPRNSFASNRTDQLAGVAKSMTPRTFVGVTLALRF